MQFVDCAPILCQIKGSQNLPVMKEASTSTMDSLIRSSTLCNTSPQTSFVALRNTTSRVCSGRSSSSGAGLQRRYSPKAMLHTGDSCPDGIIPAQYHAAVFWPTLRFHEATHLQPGSRIKSGRCPPIEAHPNCIVIKCPSRFRNASGVPSKYSLSQHPPIAAIRWIGGFAVMLAFMIHYCTEPGVFQLKVIYRPPR